MRRVQCLFGLMLAGSALTAPALAVTVTLAPSRDNTLYEDAAGSLSNGAGNHLFTGATGGFGRRRALLAFDLTGIAPGSAVQSAALSLTMDKTIAGSEAVALHRVGSNWGEGASDAAGPEGAGASAAVGDATWLHTFFSTEFWASPGGDFDPLPSATISVGAEGSYVWGTTPSMVADVQRWVDDPTTNFGWVVVGNEAALTTAKRFASRENPDPLVVPSLTVTFDPAPAVAVPAVSSRGMLLLVFTLAVAAALRLGRA